MDSYISVAIAGFCIMLYLTYIEDKIEKVKEKLNSIETKFTDLQRDIDKLEKTLEKRKL